VTQKGKQKTKPQKREKQEGMEMPANARERGEIEQNW